MGITAGQVKELREKTGVGMMKCKEALVEAGGDVAGAEKLADVQSVTATRIRVVTPVAPAMDTAGCDSIGDGEIDGTVKVDSPALVQVTYLAPDGTQKTGSLDGAFTYIPDTRVCLPVGTGT